MTSVWSHFTNVQLENCSHRHTLCRDNGIDVPGDDNEGGGGGGGGRGGRGRGRGRRGRGGRGRGGDRPPRNQDGEDQNGEEAQGNKAEADGSSGMQVGGMFELMALLTNWPFWFGDAQECNLPQISI